METDWLGVAFGIILIILSVLYYILFTVRVPAGATRYHPPELQSVEISGTATTLNDGCGTTAIRRSVTTATTGLIRSNNCTAVDPIPHIRSSIHIWQHAVARFPERPCLGRRKITNNAVGEYVFMTYSQVNEEVERIGKALVYLSGAKKQESVGIYSINRPEWSITALACAQQNLVSVALYDTLGPQACEFILTDADVVCVVTSKAYLDKLLEAIASLVQKGETVKVSAIIQMEDLEPGRQSPEFHSRYPGIELIVDSGKVFGSIPAMRSSRTKADDSQKIRPTISLTDWKSCLDFVRADAGGVMESIPSMSVPEPHDVYTISYTSGTTGTPKGVVIPHSVVAAFVAGGIYNEQEYGKYDPKLRWLRTAEEDQEVWLSYLPLAHVMERAMTEILFYAGARIGFYAGDTQRILEDAVELKPTIFASVPRIFNRVYSKATAALSSPSTPRMKKILFNLAYENKLALLKQGYVSKATFWDRLVFSEPQKRLGGRVRIILTGSAPIADYILDWFRVVFGVTVIEGYGLTETFAGLCATRQDNFKANNVGVPGATAEIRLVDVPEMRYFAKDNMGEITVRGPTVFRGYHKRDDLTKEVIDEDGFFHTGDIGKFNPDGTLSIVDRKKNLFKLSQGEYVAPEKLENVFLRSPFVAQMFVHGVATESCCVAVVVADFDHLRSWAKHHAAELIDASADDDTLAKNPKCKEAVMKSLNETGKAAGLKGFEFVKAIHLEVSAFTVQNGLLTPSFKLVRSAAREKYLPVFKKMYEEINASSPQDK